jgi:hypothetical protein
MNKQSRYGADVDYTSSTEANERHHDKALSDELQRHVDKFLENKKNKIQQIDYAGNVL